MGSGWGRFPAAQWMVELGLRSGSPDGLSCIRVGCSHHAFSDKHHVDGAACGGPAAGGGFLCKAELLSGMGTASYLPMLRLQGTRGGEEC